MLEQYTIQMDHGTTSSRVYKARTPAFATLILAHGAGAPMDSPFMNVMARGLAAEGLRVARFEFPYMRSRREQGRSRPPSWLSGPISRGCSGMVRSK